MDVDLALIRSNQVFDLRALVLHETQINRTNKNNLSSQSIILYKGIYLIN